MSRGAHAWYLASYHLVCQYRPVLTIDSSAAMDDTYETRGTFALHESFKTVCEDADALRQSADHSTDVPRDT